MENRYHHHEVAVGRSSLYMAEMSKAKPDHAFVFATAAAAAAAMPPHASSSSSWFDVRVIYVRVSGCCCCCGSEGSAPESLSMSFPPRSIGTALEVNGGRISPSEEATVVLRRDRVDPEAAEATYLSTDYVRTSGPLLSFEILFKDEALVIGKLEQQQQQQSETNSVEQQGDRHNNNVSCYNSSSSRSYEAAAAAPRPRCPRRRWNMDCICAVGQAGCVFSKPLLLRHVELHNNSTSVLSSSSASLSSCSPLAMEVCLVGRNSETPVVLSQTLPLTAARRRSNRHNTLDVIPEAEEVAGKQQQQQRSSSCSSSLMMIDHEPRLGTDGNPFMDFGDKAGAGLGCYDALEGGGGGGSISGYHLREEAAAAEGLGCALEGGSGYGDAVQDDGQMTWFNAGVRVGVGLGLGMCLGVGIGIGLVVRTYHATTRSLRKGFI